MYLLFTLVVSLKPLKFIKLAIYLFVICLGSEPQPLKLINLAVYVFVTYLRSDPQVLYIGTCNHESISNLLYLVISLK